MSVGVPVYFGSDTVVGQDGVISIESQEIGGNYLNSLSCFARLLL